MDFALSEEQEMFRAMFQGFSAKEIAPVAEELDHEEEPPVDILAKAARQGFLGATLPEEYFGAALDGVSYALLLEALARECASVAVALATHVSLVGGSILDSGTEAQKERYLPLLAAGEAPAEGERGSANRRGGSGNARLGAFALTEPDAGSDIRALGSRAVADGDYYVLHGIKTWVANGDLAGLLLVFAQAPQGIAAFLVHADWPGVTVGYREPTLGLRNVPFNTIYLEGCRVPAANRLGDEGEGVEIARWAQQRMSVALGGVGLGVARSSLDVAAQFASERVQFGVPIAEKQAIQNLIAEGAVEVEALQYLVYHAAWRTDHGREEGKGWRRLGYDASVLKVFAARVARGVTDRMVQVMGGYGYMEDYPLARKYRDARALGLVGGATELHMVRVAAGLFSGSDVEVVP